MMKNFRDMYRVLAVLIAVQVLLGMSNAAGAGEFSFDAEHGLPIRLGSQIVLDKQTQSWPAGEHEKILRAPNTLTLFGKYSRKEFVSHGDRLEYSFQFNLPATQDGLSSCLFFPLSKGANVEVLHGGHSRIATTSLVTVGESAEAIKLVRLITVKGTGPGEGFTIDTDPAGAWQDSADFDKQLGQSEVSVTPRGLRLCFTRGANRWGQGRIQAKVIFYSTPQKFESLHPFAQSGYKQPLQPLYFLDFTNRTRTNAPFSVGKESFDTQRGYGWVNPTPELVIVDRGLKALLHGGFATGKLPATFQMAAPPGDYFLTIAVGDLENAIGPMNIMVNDKAWIQGLSLGKARIENRHTVVSPTNGIISLSLTGAPWVLNSVALQPLMLEREDFQMRRSWWNYDVKWDEEWAWPEPLPERKTEGG